MKKEKLRLSPLTLTKSSSTNIDSLTLLSSKNISSLPALPSNSYKKKIIDKKYKGALSFYIKKEENYSLLKTKYKRLHHPSSPNCSSPINPFKKIPKGLNLSPIGGDFYAKHRRIDEDLIKDLSKCSLTPSERKSFPSLKEGLELYDKIFSLERPSKTLELRLSLSPSTSPTLKTPFINFANSDKYFTTISPNNYTIKRLYKEIKIPIMNTPRTPLAKLKRYSFTILSECWIQDEKSDIEKILETLKINTN
ncbi:unnamed protein product [Blepharisma stoltei]|uniref:Uncharacterized protein n=1 Tax=Blepharisma stoltei TaxID=1481888 RepID=A0AAU9IQD0_9CILI|nr:unnamed protein product [Blepharisma stoltei]